jgi:hypothetical protein
VLSSAGIMMFADKGYQGRRPGHTVQTPSAPAATVTPAAPGVDVDRLGAAPPSLQEHQ